jgi:hypothetical protein
VELVPIIEDVVVVVIVLPPKRKDKFWFLG